MSTPTTKYECYCQECDEVIEGMTEEEFENDDELKLCRKCSESEEDNDYEENTDQQVVPTGETRTFTGVVVKDGVRVDVVGQVHHVVRSVESGGKWWATRNEDRNVWCPVWLPYKDFEGAAELDYVK